MLRNLGKEDLVQFLRTEGKFSQDEALRIYGLISTFFAKVLDDGDSIYLRGVLRLVAILRHPRTYRDNLHDKSVHYGERVTHTLRNLRT